MTTIIVLLLLAAGLLALQLYIDSKDEFEEPRHHYKKRKRK